MAAPSPLEKPIVSADEAVTRIADGATVAIGGSGSGHAVPEKLLAALGRRFREQGRPSGLTLVHPFGVGNQKDRGLQHLAHPGMFRRVVGGHWSMSPAMAQLAVDNCFEAYCLPAGVIIQLFQAAAAGWPGVLTHVGLETFIDPRLEGGKLNQSAKDDLVELINCDGQNHLFYRTIPIDVSLIFAGTADPYGNLSMNGQAAPWHNCAMAQAARACGGITIAVVNRVVEPHGIHPRDVRVPGCFVDCVVLDPEQGQTYQTRSDPTFSGDARKPDSEFPSFPLSTRKVIARRAALELAPGAVLNVGFGLPDGVIKVAREEGLASTFIPTIEHGQFGGVPADGLDFGATYNADAVLETGHMFSFYHGRGVDQAYLGFLQVDRAGNVNVSRLGSTIIGIGGFIDIAQRARKLVFCGTLGVRAEFELTASGLRCVKQGAPKFVERAAQVTFSGDYARRLEREVWYVTEAAVFSLSKDGIRLEEIAPGLNLEGDILPQLGFVPPMADPLRTMPSELFGEGPLPRHLFRYYAAQPAREW